MDEINKRILMVSNELRKLIRTIDTPDSSSELIALIEERILDVEKLLKGEKY